MRATGRRQPKRNPERGPRSLGPRCRRAPIGRRSPVQGEGRGVAAVRRAVRFAVPCAWLGCPPWPCAWARLSAVAVCLGPAVRRGRVPGPGCPPWPCAWAHLWFLLVKWCRKLLSCSTYCHQRHNTDTRSGAGGGAGGGGGPACSAVGRAQFWFPFGEVVAKTALVQHLSPPTTQTDTRSGACGGAAVSGDRCGEPLWRNRLWRDRLWGGRSLRGVCGGGSRRRAIGQGPEIHVQVRRVHQRGVTTR